MLSTCGYTVCNTSTKQWLGMALYTDYIHMLRMVGYKATVYPLLHTQHFQQYTHSKFQSFTEVMTGLFPTIHNTNKNYKNFLFKKLLFIYTGAV